MSPRNDAPKAPIRYVIGIDPGKGGGIALLSEDLKDVSASLCPGEGDPAKMGAFLRDVVKHYPEIAVAVVEKVHAMPRQGVSSTFAFGEQCGIWLGALAACGITVIRVTPQKWQGLLLNSRDKTNKDRDTKDLSLERARILYPNVDMKRQKDNGKADALHLARYGVLWLKGEIV